MLPIAHGNFSGKRLVIFGCGYVGGEVARQARAAGLQVTALTRNSETAASLGRMGVDVVIDDLAGDAWYRRIPGKADFVLNAVSSGGGGIEGYRHSYVAGMQSIVRWADFADQIGTIVYTSSTSVYPQDGGAVVDETASTASIGERAQLLLEAERLLSSAKSVRPAAGTSGIPASRFQRFFILRLAGIYGPGRNYLLTQIASGRVAGEGRHRLNLIHRDDIAAAIWSVFAAPPQVADEIFNVADDGPAPKSEIVEWLAHRLGSPMPKFTGAPAEGRRAITPDRLISNEKLKRVVGWRPRYHTFREGYEQILAAG